MKDAFELNTIMYRVLAAANIGNNGGIYKNDTRPVDSKAEDIVVNVIALELDELPQKATTNVNIYVADTPKKINGKDMLVEDSTRMKELSRKVVDALKSAHIEGLKFLTESQSIFDEPSINQHCVNIRVRWNIQTD